MTREEGIRAAIERAKARGKDLVYCVAGGGNGGLPMAGYLGLGGFRVRLYNRTEEKLAAVRWQGGVELEGAVEGFGPVEAATSDIREALDGADVVMVVTPSTAHRDLAAAMAPCLAPGQIVVLNPGRTGGALEFHKVLKDSGSPILSVLAEAQTFIFASRALSRGRGRIFSIKRKVPLAALPSYWTPDILEVLKPAFPQFTAGSNVLATSMENIGAIFHPALTLLNAGWIESSGGDFDYYLQGITPSVALVLEKMDKERLAVAGSLGVRSVSALEWLYLSYGSSGQDLHEAIGNTEAYRGIRAPASIDHRYIFEDVPMSLVPIASLGAQAGIPTPTIDMIIDLASLVHGRDYRKEGRTVERLGLSGLSVMEIHNLVLDPEGREKLRKGKKE